MQIRSLGWAGFEVAAGGESLVIDALDDPLAVFAFLEGGEGAPAPAVVPPSRQGRALAGLVSHLHRDHADAAALSAALADGAEVLEPESGGGEGLENLGLAQAEHELAESGLARRRLSPWESATVGGFELTALPAVDGSGDPQVSWLIESQGLRVLHLGDTLFHGYWWRIALRCGPFDAVLAPINGAVLDVPHRRPASPFAAAMDPEQAAVAGEILGAPVVVPMHYGGLGLDPFYSPVENAEERFLAAAAERSFEPRVLAAGEVLELAPAAHAVA